MLVWHSSYFVGCSVKKKRIRKKKKKSYSHSIFTSLVFGISMVCPRYYEGPRRDMYMKDQAECQVPLLKKKVDEA